MTKLKTPTTKTIRLTSSMRGDIVRAVNARVPEEMRPAHHRSIAEHKLDEAVQVHAKAMLPEVLHPFWRERPAAFSHSYLYVPVPGGYSSVTVAPGDFAPTDAARPADAQFIETAKALATTYDVAVKPYYDMLRNLNDTLRGCSTLGQLLAQMPELSEVVASLVPAAPVYPVATDSAAKATAALLALGAALP